MRNFKTWAPVLFWMIVIFIASTDLGSSQHTSRIIGPILRWFYPQVSQPTIDRVQAFVRKSGHVSEYALLALIIWRSRRRYRAPDPFWTWNWREAGLIVLACGFYACTDEFHQWFVSTRYASLIDVLIDSAGAAGGLFFLWVFGRSFRKW
jgi:VanZ family protein